MKNKNYLSTQKSKRNFFFKHDNFFFDKYKIFLGKTILFF